jgi:hypothetical protein
MQYLPNGEFQYDNVNELYYNLFLEIGLFINQHQYIQDTDTGIVLQYKKRYIKADLSGNPVYAGVTDVIFDPPHNYGLISTLLGYYIDKKTAEGEDIGYTAQAVVDTDDYHQVLVRTTHGDVLSKPYHNVYLGYIEVIMTLGGTRVDLRNLDIVEEEEDRRRR